MKRHLHFYQWLLCLLLTMGSHLSVFSQEKTFFVEDLQNGDVIKIYPYGHYNEASMALTCDGEWMGLTSKAGKGSEWTLIGDPYRGYILRNELGYYWAYQGRYIDQTLFCTKDIGSAVEVGFSWDNKKNRGVLLSIDNDYSVSEDLFFVLENLEGKNIRYNWTSSFDTYDSDTNSTFEVYCVNKGGIIDADAHEVVIDGIKYWLNVERQTAEVLASNYEGNVVIPQVVSCKGREFQVKYLDSECFKECTRLTSITLPEGITELPQSCFENCSSLTSVTLPKGITSLEKSCFRGCSSLTSITLPEGITSLGESCFRGCSSLTSITLPEGITSLGCECFFECSSLTCITFPKGITSMDDACFAGCSSLTSITLPKGITSLGSYCFSGCSSLLSITLPEGITSLGKRCFWHCTRLTSINFPSSLKTLYYDTFEDAMQKKRIIINTITPPEALNSSNYGLIDSNCTLYVPKGTLATYKKTYPWYRAGAFYEGKPIDSISLPSDVSFAKTEKKKIIYSVLPIDANQECLKWNCSNPKIVSFDKETGVVTALKAGDATLTATVDDGSGISASTIVHVTPIKVSNIDMPREITLLRTTSDTLAATITPELADDKTLKWTSDNEDIATVTQEGVVTGVNVGSANVTATTTDGTEISATCKVTVNPVTINLSTNTINLQKGSEYVEQTATILPENYEHKDVVWTTSGNGVTSVDKDGHITANKPGVDTLRCSLSYDSHIYSECRVIVYEDNVVYVGGLYYLLKGTTDENREATVTSIYGGKNTSLDAKNVAQYYSGTINIPETIIYDGNKYTVRKVGSYAFNCQNELQSIYIPRTVTEVEPHAAIKAEKLNRVNVADESELVNIGEEAFKWCTGLKRFTFDGTSLKMNSIDKAAFRECTALERFTWMGNTTVKTIGHSAFYDCSALEKVLWNGKSELKTIQDYAFFKCISLNNFEMPNTTLSVGNSSFRYNASLTNIHLSTSLNYIDEYAYGECGFSQITLPESLANIQAGAFINNDFLQEIILPERLQGLGSAAFENNSKLESVTFHTAIETMTIGNNAFNQCPILNKVYITNMNSFAQTNFNNAKANPANTSQHIYDANGKEIINVVLPKGTKYVNNNAFNGCAFIESIEMPATMDHVNDDIFVGCSALKDVYCYAEEVPEFIGVNDPTSMDEVFQNATLHVPFGSESLYQKDTSWWGKFTKLLGCEPKPTAVVEKIDLSTLTVNVKAGENYNEQKLTIYPAEAANVRIKYSTADRKVADIDENGVIKGVAPGVTTIYYTANDGNGVTSECKVIVRNPEVEYVGDIYYLFDKAKKEATVTSIYGGKNKSLDVEKVAQVYTGTVSIPEQTTFNAVTYDVKKVGGYAFTCQNELQALRVGAFVEKIEDNAATKAMNLNRVTVANASQLVTVGKRSFMDCAGLQHVLFEGTTQYLDVIDTAAFKNCAKLEDVIWEGKSTLRLIGDSAFYCDSKLKTVKWNDKCDLKIIDNYAFYKCSSFNHFIMPNSTLSVGKYAFRYDAGLTDIQLSTSLSIIYDYAFGECGFSQIVLPESLKSMQAGAFINNSNLADITIPKKTEGIGAGAFENCSALESVTFKTHETKLTVDKNAFNHCAVLSKVNIDYLDDWAHINFQNAAANPASTAHRLYLNGEELLDVELPVGTKYIGNNVFNGCSDIRTLKIPATVEHVNDNIIAGCSSLTDVYCYATKVPSFIGTEDPSSMNDVFRKATLHVIYGNEEAYKADAWWKRFYKIEGCKDPGVEDVKVSSITISQTEITLKPDDTLQLEATVYPTEAANKSVIWKSSNEDVVIVTDEGFVLAVAEGEADVTVASAENSEIKAVCHIKVEKEKEPEVPIVQIKFEESPVTIALGETKKLNVIFNPVNATNKELDWVSAKSSVVEVDKEGNILGVSEGKAIVSAKTKDGSNLTINCVVTVIPSTGISNITMGEVKLIVNNRHLKVEGLADHEVIQVVNSIGFTVYRGTDHEIDLKAAGVYIIKVKGKTLKFSVK